MKEGNKKALSIFAYVSLIAVFIWFLSLESNAIVTIQLELPLIESEDLTMWVLSKNSLNRREGVDKRLIEISDMALSISPIDFGVPEFGGLRTIEDQKGLCDKGVSPYCDGTINRSLHQDGLALDFYAYVDGKATWNPMYLTTVAAAHLQAASRLGYKIRWGGFFKSFTDMPHIELQE